MNDIQQKLTEIPADGHKLLLVVRHAKSSWETSSLNDFERPLNDRGKKDAPMMAKRLIDKKIMVDAFVSSPAKRAKKTAELFCEAYDKPGETIEYVSMLYQAPEEVFLAVVEQLNNSLNTVALFSHNPGVTDFVNSLTDEMKIDNMPTCGIFALQVQLKKWVDFKKAKKEFIFLDYPKLV
ncbi:MAG: histidine phosphatase family protein [Ferruginibacter sp.]